MSSPVARTLEVLRAAGGDPAVVERFVPRGPIHGIRIDLYGIADIECLFPDFTLYVQVCRSTDLAAHFATCCESEFMPKLLACPARRFEIWSWAKQKNLWGVRRYVAALPEGAPANAVVFVERRAA